MPLYRRILHATDFSKASGPALQAAVALAAAMKAELRLVHVVDNSPVLSYYTLVYQAHRINTTRRRQAMEALKRLAERKAGARIRTRLEVRIGKPAEQILEAARRGRADLLVLGTHGYSGLEQALLGSTADKVARRSQVPVLIVPSSRAARRR